MGPPKTLEEIKQIYKYAFKPDEYIERTYDDFIGRLESSYGYYYFEKRLEKLRKILKEKSAKIGENTLQLYQEKIEALQTKIFSLRKQIIEESNSTWYFLSDLRINFEKNMNNPNATNIYQNIFKEIFDNEVKKFINYEKKYMLFSDNINDLDKQLNFY